MALSVGRRVSRVPIPVNYARNLVDVVFGLCRSASAARFAVEFASENNFQAATAEAKAAMAEKIAATFSVTTRQSSDTSSAFDRAVEG